MKIFENFLDRNMTLRAFKCAGNVVERRKQIGKSCENSTNFFYYLSFCSKVFTYNNFKNVCVVNYSQNVILIRNFQKSKWANHPVKWSEQLYREKLEKKQ